MLRDQERAMFAYRAVKEVPPRDQKDYKIIVNAFGSNILHLGLAAAVSALEREVRGKLLLSQLSSVGKDEQNHAKIPGLENVSAQALPEKVRGLDLDGYVLATRETLKIAVWLKRAAQASFKE